MQVLNRVMTPLVKYSMIGLAIVILEMLIWNIFTGDPIDIVNSALIGGFFLLSLKFKPAMVFLSLVVLEMMIWNIVTGDPIDITNAILIMGLTLLALKKVGLSVAFGRKNYMKNT